MSATATLDPALTVRAAVRGLYDRLKEIIDRGPTEDPSLLDELRTIARQDGGRITRAMKKLAAAEPAAAKQEPATQQSSDQPAVKPALASKQPATTVPAVPAVKPADGGDRVSVRLPASSAAAARATTTAAPASHPGPMRAAGRIATAVADAGWKSVRGALVAVAVGAIGALGGRGMAEAGISPVLIWLWGIAFFAAFVGGLCFWAMSASKRWGQPAAAATSTAEPVSGDEPEPTTPVNELVEVPPGQVIAWEEESDRDYRRFVELHRP